MKPATSDPCRCASGRGVGFGEKVGEVGEGIGRGGVWGEVDEVGLR